MFYAWFVDGGEKNYQFNVQCFVCLTTLLTESAK